jgi:hypothetical protein
MERESMSTRLTNSDAGQVRFDTSETATFLTMLGLSPAVGEEKRVTLPDGNIVVVKVAGKDFTPASRVVLCEPDTDRDNKEANPVDGNVLKRRKDGGWFLRFQKKEHRLEHMLGLVYYARLLAEPFSMISAIRLSRLTHEAEAGRSAVTHDEFLESEDDEYSSSRGTQPFTFFTKQPVTDHETLQACRKRMEWLAVEIDKERVRHNDGLVEKWQEEFYQIGEHVADCLDYQGNIRAFCDSDKDEQARSAVAKAMQRTREQLVELDPQLQDLVNYLRQSVKGKEKGFVFLPGTNDVSWDASWVVRKEPPEDLRVPR